MFTIYKASAGSGKTFTLAAQYIANLLRTPNPQHRHILAVTFTNKATAEMKSRILQHLYAIAYGRDPQNGFFVKVKTLIDQADLPDDELRKRASKALSQILDNYDDFAVTTIDSFFQQLLSSLAHDLGLASSIEVDLGDKDVVAKAVNRLLAEASTDVQLADWITVLSRNRLLEGKSWQVAGDLSKLANELLKERYLSRENRLSDAVMTDLFVNNFYTKLKEKYDDTVADIKACADQFDAEVIDFGGYDCFKNGKKSLQAFVSKLQAQTFEKPSDTVMKMVESDNAWVYAKSSKFYAKSLDAPVALRQKLQGLIETFNTNNAGLNTITLSIAWIRQLRLMRRVENELHTINKEEGRFMLAYTPSLFRELIYNADAQFVLERAGINYHHIMIDEFQDTSPMQWDNMRELLIGSLASGNDCLLVGDVKQGIYRFRGGDWSTLQRASDKFPDCVKTLQQNFRSGAVIVDFNNRLFGQMAACIDQWQREQGQPPTDLPQIYSDVAQTAPRGNYGTVEVNFVISPSKTKNQSPNDQPQTPLQMPKQACPVPVEGQCSGDTSEQVPYDHSRDVYDTICSLRQSGVEYRDIVILIHKDNEAVALANAFQSYGAEFQVVNDKAFQLQSSQSVQIIIAALRLLQTPHDSISRQILTNYAVTQLGIDTLPTHYQELIGGKYRRYLLMQNIVTIIEAFRLNEAPSQDGYLFSFLEVAQAWSDENPSSISDFLTDWDQTLSTSKVVPDALDAVRAMTIHKSKGLDFKAVLIPYADWAIFQIKQDFERMDFLWCETLVSGEDGETTSRLPISADQVIPMLPIPLLNAMEKSAYLPEFQKECHDQRIENINLLYVACTRACQHLSIWTNIKHADSDQITTVGDLMFNAITKPSDTAPSLFDPADSQDYSLQQYSDVELHKYTWRQSANSQAIVQTVTPDQPFDNPLVISQIRAEQVPLTISHRTPPVVMVADTDE